MEDIDLGKFISAVPNSCGGKNIDMHRVLLRDEPDIGIIVEYYDNGKRPACSFIGDEGVCMMGKEGDKGYCPFYESRNS